MLFFWQSSSHHPKRESSCRFVLFALGHLPGVMSGDLNVGNMHCYVIFLLLYAVYYRIKPKNIEMKLENVTFSTLSC